MEAYSAIPLYLIYWPLFVLNILLNFADGKAY